MTVRNLEFLFRPNSIAVVTEPGEPGYYPDIVLRNLAAGGYGGQVIRIDMTKHWLFGIGRRPRIGQQETVPELAITCTPLENVPRIVLQLGAMGTRAVIVGPARIQADTDVPRLRAAILDAARPFLMRILGPGSGGIMVPTHGLNASVSPASIGNGKVALVTQSAAIAAAVLDRAATQGVGFSTVLHLGNSIDVDLADTLDWLATDPATEAILVQFENVPSGRKFMSAARAAARNKTVVAIRSPGSEMDSGATAACRVDHLYEAAIRRAGWVRVETLEGLFEAVEAMAWVRMPRGEKLCILANGNGLGRIAANSLQRNGGRLTELSESTRQQLKQRLPSGFRMHNPLALAPDTSAADWAAVLSIVLADPATDAVLTVHSPTAFNNSADIAQAISDVARDTDRNVFTCWLGGNSMQAARQIAATGSMLCFDAPEKATAVFQRIVTYVRNRQLLAQLPPSQALDFAPEEHVARTAIAESFALGEKRMSLPLARRLLQAYCIVASESAGTAPSGEPLRLGITEDPVFGPIIYLGHASMQASPPADCAIALPPLNLELARDLVTRSGVIETAATEEQEALAATLCTAIVHLSQLLTDIDEVATVELDPLHVNATEVVARDPRIQLAHRGRHHGFRRFAIRPYPKELERHLDWEGRTLLIRPIRPEDETTLSDLLLSLDADDARMRFFGTMRGLPRSQLARFTQIDYDREMALVAIERAADGSEHCLGEVRIVIDPDNLVADFAIVVRSALKGKGLGRQLMQDIVDYARSRGVAELRGETLAGNLRMQRLAQELGFELGSGTDPGTITLLLNLQPTA
jgi:acetyltransferase